MTTTTHTLALVHALLNEALAYFGHPEQASAGLGQLLTMQDLLADALAAPQEISSADEIHARMTTPFPITLATGSTVEVRSPDLISEMLAGSLPNRVLDQVVFGKDLDEGQKTDKRQVAEWVRGLLNIAARALVRPILILDREPNHAQGEIGIGDLRLGDLLTIRQRALWDVLPEVQDAPFLGASAPG